MKLSANGSNNGNVRLGLAGPMLKSLSLPALPDVNLKNNFWGVTYTPSIATSVKTLCNMQITVYEIAQMGPP